MATPNPGAFDEFLEKLERRDRQRKMTRISVDETSGVLHPAHLVEGWIVLKSADGEHDHRPDATYLEGQALESSRMWGTDTMQPGQSIAFAKDRFLGKSNCGCVYMRTPNTIDKAESDAWVASYQKSMTKAAGYWTPDEIAWFEAETKRIQR